jgi:hypothetical protein
LDVEDREGKGGGRILCEEGTSVNLNFLFLGLFALLVTAGLLTVCLAEGGLFNRVYLPAVKEVPLGTDPDGKPKRQRYRSDDAYYAARYGRSPSEGMGFEEIPGEGRYQLRLNNWEPIYGFWLSGIGGVGCVFVIALRRKAGKGSGF